MPWRSACGDRQRAESTVANRRRGGYVRGWSRSRRGDLGNGRAPHLGSRRPHGDRIRAASATERRRRVDACRRSATAGDGRHSIEPVGNHVARRLRRRALIGLCERVPDGDRSRGADEHDRDDSKDETLAVGRCWASSCPQGRVRRRGGVGVSEWCDPCCVEHRDFGQWHCRLRRLDGSRGRWWRLAPRFEQPRVGEHSSEVLRVDREAPVCTPNGRKPPVAEHALDGSHRAVQALSGLLSSDGLLTHPRECPAKRTESRAGGGRTPDTTPCRVFGGRTWRVVRCTAWRVVVEPERQATVSAACRPAAFRPPRGVSSRQAR